MYCQNDFKCVSLLSNLSGFQTVRNKRTNWWLPDDCLMTAWWQPDDYLMTAWRLLDDSQMTTWWLPDDCLKTAWRLMTAWSLPDDCLITTWWLPNDGLMTTHFISVARIIVLALKIIKEFTIKTSNFRITNASLIST